MSNTFDSLFDIMDKPLTKTKPGNWPATSIHHYKNLNWVKVCDVNQTVGTSGFEWYYSNIDTNVMFDTHTSWVYALTENSQILKIGETGHPLGISGSWSYDKISWEDQPKKGTTCRLGRYRAGDSTDARIRNALINRINNNIEFWAIKCPVISHKFDFLSETKSFEGHIHKQLEKALLDYFEKNVGRYPELNQGRC
jgi:predicted DNA-binding transcriptional regulator AlpA